MRTKQCHICKKIIKGYYAKLCQSCANRIRWRKPGYKTKVAKKISETRKKLGLGKGSKNHNWNGGIMIMHKRYRYILMPMHPDARPNGYILEHRLIAEKMIGRRLKKKEVVHHINRNTFDNRPENLKVLSGHAEHRREHKITSWSIAFNECINCGLSDEKHYHHARGLCKPCHDKKMKGYPL